MDELERGKEKRETNKIITKDEEINNQIATRG